MPLVMMANVMKTGRDEIKREDDNAIGGKRRDGKETRKESRRGTNERRKEMKT